MQHRTPSPNTQSGASVKFRADKNTHTDSPPQNNRGCIGFGSCGRALHVLKSGDPGANVGAFAETAAIPLRAPVAFLTRGVS